RARYISRRVHPALEVGVRAACMAAQTGRVDVARRHRREPFDPGLVAGVDMRLAGTMARFTALIRFRSRCPGVLCLAVKRRVKRLALRLVAGRTPVVADEATGLRRRRSHDGRRRRWRLRRGGGNGSAPGCCHADRQAPHDREHGNQPACRITVTAFQHSPDSDVWTVGFPAGEPGSADTTAKAGPDLLNHVTAVAVLADLPPILRLVVVVVTAETAWKVHVSEVVWIGSESDVHLGKDVAAIDRLNCLDGFLDVRPL